VAGTQYILYYIGVGIHATAGTLKLGQVHRVTDGRDTYIRIYNTIVVFTIIGPIYNKYFVIHIIYVKRREP